VRVMFAEDESRVTLHGFSSMPPDVRVANGSFEALKYDPQTGRFRFAVSRGPGGWTDIVIRAQSAAENRPSTRARKLYSPQWLWRLMPSEPARCACWR
jgi:hypothetical protein